MKTKNSTFKNVLTTGKKTLTVAMGIALGFAAPYVIAAKAPSNAASNADIFHRIAQERVERTAEPTAQNLGAQIEELAKGLGEGYQLAKSEAVRQSRFVGYVNDQTTLNTFGAPKEAEGAYILSEDNKISADDIVLPIDKEGNFIPKSYVLGGKVPENVKTYVPLVENNSTEGTSSYTIDNNGNVLSNFTLKDEVLTGNKTLEETVTRSSAPCANVKVTWYGREYVANATTIVNMTGDDYTRTAPISTGAVDCNTPPTSTLENIDATTIAWSCDTTFQDLYGVK